MKILVTGGAGFIGSHLCEALVNLGHIVTAVDDLSTGSEKNLKSLLDKKEFRFIYGDILTLDGFESLIEDSDFIYHLAAAVGVEMVVNRPIHTIQTNIKGTERVLESANRKKTKIILASTSEVYGKSFKDTFSETDDLLIGAPTHSRWSYACSKLLDEFYATSYYREENLPVNVIRFFNTVGPRQTGKYGMVLPRFVKSALKNETLLVYGSGKQTRCFCHVLDVVRALINFLGVESFGEVYNVGSQESVSINELAERVISITGSSSRIEHLSYDKAYAPGFEDMLHRAPDIRKVKALIDWYPTFDLDSIIKDVAEFMAEKTLL